MIAIILFILLFVIIISFLVYIAFKKTKTAFYVFIGSLFIINGVCSFIDSFNDDTRLNYCQEIYGKDYVVSNSNYFNIIPVSCQMEFNGTTITKRTRGDGEVIDYPFIIIILISMIISICYEWGKKDEKRYGRTRTMGKMK